ncbi:putative acetyltransferase [Pseudovibrio sp. Ad46]|uniref:GNAT family N-acetyltransferase n=1 Tax=Pseudovibrio sp. Ad46 TaxID=989432 RepID=UPI0007B2AF78|nr:GNAT family N-acetyltransferase [Pseudovibrio sp. Ad46]KZK90424.1 putative acetyltransferase [Pseudovibrio sp. Ad46]
MSGWPVKPDLEHGRQGLLQIQPYTSEDHDVLAALYESVASRTFAYDYTSLVDASQFQSLVEGEDVWVLKYAGERIGFIGYFTPEHFLHSLYIDYAHHKRGFGRQALQFLLENYGCRHELKVHRINQPALKFYSALGYEDITAQADAHQTWQRLRSPEAILDHSPAIAVGEQVSYRQ